MPNTTVPANATALPAETLPRVFPRFAKVGEGAPSPMVLSQRQPASDRFLDFEADDSGAMQHDIELARSGERKIPCDAYEEFLVAFKALMAVPVAGRAKNAMATSRKPRASFKTGWNGSATALARLERRRRRPTGNEGRTSPAEAF